MAIGSTINVSIPVVGTTVETFDKVRDGLYSNAMTIASTDYPATIAIRPTGNILDPRKRTGLTYKVSPSKNDEPIASAKGSLSVSINIDATTGTVITTAELAKQVRFALSAMLASTLVETLVAGSNQ